VTHADYPAFHDRVYARRLEHGEHDPDTLGAEHVVEHRHEFGVAVTDQEFEVACVVAQVEHQVAGPLDDPCGGRVRGDTHDPDAACGVLDDGEAVQPGQPPVFVNPAEITTAIGTSPPTVSAESPDPGPVSGRGTAVLRTPGILWPDTRLTLAANRYSVLNSKPQPELEPPYGIEP
jgi:hypothetical protein